MTTLRLALLLLLAMLLVNCGSPPFKGKITGETYYSPDGEFSIRIASFELPSKETVLPDRVLVDFYLKGDPAVFGAMGLSTIEWLKLSLAMTPAEFTSTAPALAREIVAKRFAEAGTFEFSEGRPTSEEAGAPYRFLALGMVGKRRVSWVGQITHFGDRIAIVSHLTPEGAIGKPITQLSETSPALAAWLMSVHRER
jgi:hypothetical protein